MGNRGINVWDGWQLKLAWSNKSSSYFESNFAIFLSSVFSNTSTFKERNVLHWVNLLVMITFANIFRSTFCWSRSFFNTFYILFIFYYCQQVLFILGVSSLLSLLNQGRRESGRGGGWAGGAIPPPFSGANIFFPCKIEKHKIFISEEHLKLEFIYWTRRKWQKLDIFFWICHFSSKLIYHSYQQQVCKILFFIKTFVKRNSNLMCGSL